MKERNIKERKIETLLSANQSSRKREIENSWNQIKLKILKRVRLS